MVLLFIFIMHGHNLVWNDCGAILTFLGALMFLPDCEHFLVTSISEHHNTRLQMCLAKENGNYASATSSSEMGGGNNSGIRENKLFKYIMKSSLEPCPNWTTLNIYACHFLLL